MKLPADRVYSSNVRTVRTSAGMNYTEHFTEVHYEERDYFIIRV